MSDDIYKDNENDEDDLKESTKKQLELNALLQKIKAGEENITNKDILSFLTIINYNLSVILQMFRMVAIRLEAVEEIVEEGNSTGLKIQKELTHLMDEQKEFSNLLDGNKKDDEDLFDGSSNKS